MTPEIFNVVQSTPTPQGHTQRIKRVRSDQKYKHNLTYTEKDSLFTLIAIVLMVMLLIVLQAPLILLNFSLLNSFQNFSQSSLDYTCLTCSILPLEEYSTKGSFSRRTLMLS